MLTTQDNAPNFLQQLQRQKQQLSQFLLNFLEQEEQKLQDQLLAPAVFSKLKSFVVSGKMARGGLFLLTYQQLLPLLPQASKAALEPEQQLAVAAALELTHSGLLIHDDIIDRDQLRRGQPSIWQQFRTEAEAESYAQPLLYGQSLAICSANICFYLAQQLLDNLTIAAELKKEVKSFFNQEIIRVNLAEMLDVKLALQNNQAQQAEILAMYRYKTGRYTFALPLILAGSLAALPATTLNTLEKVGENLGLIFQIKDDEIGLFATENTSGKTAASDLREGKRTIFYHFLLRKLSSKKLNQDKRRFLQSFGHADLNQQELAFCQQLMRRHALPAVQQLTQKLAQEVRTDLDKIDHLGQLLSALLEYNLQRRT